MSKLSNYYNKDGSVNVRKFTKFVINHQEVFDEMLLSGKYNLLHPTEWMKDNRISSRDIISTYNEEFKQLTVASLSDDAIHGFLIEDIYIQRFIKWFDRDYIRNWFIKIDGRLTEEKKKLKEKGRTIRRTSKFKDELLEDIALRPYSVINIENGEDQNTLYRTEDPNSPRGNQYREILNKWRRSHIGGKNKTYKRRR